MHKKEQIFLDKYSNKNKTYIYCKTSKHLIRNWFNFDNNVKYQPDFYCVEDGKYIEVIGSKQAFNQNKYKYLLMAKEYPHITLEFIAIDCYPNKKNNDFKTIILDERENGGNGDLNYSLHFRVTKEEKEELGNMAKKDNSTMSIYLRRILFNS